MSLCTALAVVNVFIVLVVAGFMLLARIVLGEEESLRAQSRGEQPAQAGWIRRRLARWRFFWREVVGG